MTQPPNPAVTLLPCPFCGGEAYLGRTTYSRPLDDAWWADGSKISETHRINCASCGGNTGGGPIGGQQTPEKAIAAWNTRQSNPVAAGVGEGLRFYALPFAFHEPSDNNGAAYVRDANGQAVAMMMWPGHSMEDEDAAVAETYVIGRAIAALSTPPESARDALLLGGDAMRGEGK